MKSRFLMVLLLCSVCVAEEKTTLPLPDPGNVTLTLDEYNKLVELAARPPKKLETAPLPYSIQVGSSRVDLQACKLEYSIVSPK